MTFRYRPCRFFRATFCNTAVVLLSSWILLVAGGCPQTSPTSPPVRSGGWGSDSPTPSQSATENGTGSADTNGDTTAAAPKPAEQSGEETVRVAAPGVTGKGDYSTAPAVMQPITVPVSAYFATRERMIFNIQIPEALKLFEAEHGQKPSSHEEFMEKIIQYNQIKLPQLKNDTDRYQYDPKDGQLKVLSRK